MKSLPCSNPDTSQYLRDYVRWCYQVDVMTTPLLQACHHRGKGLAGQGISGSALADLVVLAEFAGKVTVRKKDSTGSKTPYQGRFLPKMRAETCYFRQKPCPAESPLIVETVYPAVPRAYRTGFQQRICTVNPLFQFAGFGKGTIGRVVWFTC
jgi:hypothetical protein